MSEQLAFKEFGAEGEPRDNLFLAIFPEALAVTRIGRLAETIKREHGLRGRILAPDRFHISLLGFGVHRRLPQTIVAVARKAAKAIAARPFDVAFDRVESFRGKLRHPLVLLGSDGVVGLTAFQSALCLAAKKAGLGYASKGTFTPHVTLLYDRKPVTEQPVDTIRWTVREFALVHSLVGTGRYVLLERWPLLG